MGAFAIEDNAQIENTQEQTTAAVTKNNSDKQNKKFRKKYIKNTSTLKKLEESKRIKERDLNFYKNRLEVKKSRLEDTSDGNEKGENNE